MPHISGCIHPVVDVGLTAAQGASKVPHVAYLTPQIEQAQCLAGHACPCTKSPACSKGRQALRLQCWGFLTFFSCAQFNRVLLLAGGLLQDDWVTPDEFKLALLAYVNPTPSLLRAGSDNRIRIDNSQPHPPPAGFPECIQGPPGSLPASNPAVHQLQRASEVGSCKPDG